MVDGDDTKSHENPRRQESKRKKRKNSSRRMQGLQRAESIRKEEVSGGGEVLETDMEPKLGPAQPQLVSVTIPLLINMYKTCPSYFIFSCVKCEGPLIMCHLKVKSQSA